jgi:uncharacterized protein
MHFRSRDAAPLADTSLRMSENVRRVTFESDGAKLVGNLFFPPNTSSGRAPALIVSGSWLTVKEQMPAVYAARMAAEGFAALAFDFRGWGESAGGPRFHENPERKVRDMRSAITFLRTLPGIDPTRIGALAVCASSGYAALASTEEPALRSMAMVAPWLHDAGLVRHLYGGEQGVQERLSAGRAARAEYERSGALAVVPAASKTDVRAAMCGDFPYYLDPTRGAIGAWDNKFAVMSWVDWLELDAIRVAPRVTTPTLIVHSEQGAIPDGARRFHAGLGGPKQIRWTDGDQFAFYDREPQVSFSVKAAVEHFRATMGQA